MTPAQMLAEAERLDAEIEAVLTVDTQAYFQRLASEGKDPMPPGWRLRTSKNSTPLQARADDLRRLAAFGEIAGAPVAAATTAAKPFTQADVDAAIAAALAATSGISAMQGGAAPSVPPPTPALTAEQEIDEVVARIVGVPVGELMPRPEARQPNPAPSAELDAADLDAIAARIAAA